MNVVALNSALALARRGHRVSLLTRRDDPGAPASVELRPGVTLFNLDAGPARPVAKSEQEVLIEPFSEALSGWFLRAGHQADIIHSHHWFSGVAALPIARAVGVPHLQSFHSVAAPAGSSLDEGEQPESSGRNAGEQQVAQQSDLIIAVSEAERRTIIDRLGAGPDLVTVVYPGVDTEQFRPLRPAEPHWAWDGCYLFFAARLQPLKGPDLAVRTLAALPEGHRPRLVIAGETSADFSWYASQLRELVDSLGLTDEVTYLGSQDRDELATMMRGACALLNPSRSETYGLINLEASASGVPVVASRNGGMPESVIDGETGLLLSSRDPEVWAEAVRRFTDEAEYRAMFSQAGRTFALQHTWSHVARELEARYLEELVR